jgi:hypothetical protein
MRTALALTLVASVALLGVPTTGLAAAKGQLQGECVTIEGVIADADGKPLAGYTAQLRQIEVGGQPINNLVQTVKSDGIGNFSFKNVFGPAKYVIEIVGPEGIMGVSPPVEAPKECRVIGVGIITASGAAGAAAGAAAAGSWLFSTAGIVAITASGVAGFTVAQGFSSPSQ